MKKKRGILNHETKTNRIRIATHSDPIICGDISSQQYHHEQASFAPFQHYYDWSSIRVPYYLHPFGPSI